MSFKELKRGLPVYILNKETLEYITGKVSQDATPPRLNTTFGQPMIVDVSIESQGTIKIWSLPADQQIAEIQTDANTVIATDKTPLISIIKSIKTDCENYIQGVDLAKEKLAKADQLIAELDVVFKQQQQTEERFVRLEQSIDSINHQLENTLSQILKAVNNGR